MNYIIYFLLIIVFTRIEEYKKKSYLWTSEIDNTFSILWKYIEFQQEKDVVFLLGIFIENYMLKATPDNGYDDRT